MKNALKYVLLWQRKRNEMPVDDDPKADWDQMRSLLDQHLPIVQKPGGFKGFKTLPAILITFSAAAMIYVTGNIYSLEKHKHTVEHHHFHKGNPLRPDPHFAGLTDSLRSDTSNILPGRKDAAGQRSDNPAVNHHNDPLATDARASNGKNNNAVPAAGKPGHTSNTGNQQSNSLPASRQNIHPGKRLMSANKTGLNGGGSLRNNPVVVARGRHSNNNGRTPGQNRAGSNHTNTNNPGQTAAAFNSFKNRGQRELLTPAVLPALTFDSTFNKMQPLTLPVLNSPMNQTPFAAGNQVKRSKKDIPPKSQNSKPSNIDWGLLIGVNTSGSFTPKSQNNNFYGSAPIDPWFGLFASYKINANWAIATQVHFFSPQNIVTSYTHANQSKVDSGQSLTVTASRKMYAVSVPIYAVYHTGGGLHFKAGPVINFPVRQINAGSVLWPYSIRTDTSYYKNISTVLNATQYRQSINFGFSVGADYQFKRFIFEATYLKSLSGYGISSGLGAYKSYNGTVRFAIGFQLDKVKP